MAEVKAPKISPFIIEKLIKRLESTEYRQEVGLNQTRDQLVAARALLAQSVT
ncbi:hypothetical protein [robinz microvirus RP_41]|nr:hypothetical protein [robinz microvirus RP_41]